MDTQVARAKYYSSHFPAEMLCDRLLIPALGSKELVHHLELSMDQPAETPRRGTSKTAAKPRLDEVFVTRYLTFGDAQGMRRILADMTPIAAGWGSLQHVPGEFKSQVLEDHDAPLGKLLVGDIDFDEVPRSCDCGTEKKICTDCWNTIGLPLVDMIGYRCREMLEINPLVCFTGRRGLQFYLPKPAYTFCGIQDRDSLISMLENLVTDGQDSGFMDRKVTVQWDHTASIPFGCKPSGFISRPVSPATHFEDLFIDVSGITSSSNVLQKRFSDALTILEEYNPFNLKDTIPV